MPTPYHIVEALPVYPFKQLSTHKGRAWVEPQLFYQLSAEQQKQQQDEVEGVEQHQEEGLQQQAEQQQHQEQQHQRERIGTAGSVEGEPGGSSLPGESSTHVVVQVSTGQQVEENQQREQQQANQHVPSESAQPQQSWLFRVFGFIRSPHGAAAVEGGGSGAAPHSQQRHQEQGSSCLHDLAHHGNCPCQAPASSGFSGGASSSSSGSGELRSRNPNSGSSSSTGGQADVATLAPTGAEQGKSTAAAGEQVENSNLALENHVHGGSCGEGEEEEDACTICLTEFDSQHRVMLLPCGHYYHATCLRGWLARDCTCPLCKQVVSITEQQAGEKRGAKAAGLQSIVVDGP